MKTWDEDAYGEVKGRGKAREIEDSGIGSFRFRNNQWKVA